MFVFLYTFLFFYASPVCSKEQSIAYTSSRKGGGGERGRIILENNVVSTNVVVAPNLAIAWIFKTFMRKLPSFSKHGHIFFKRILGLPNVKLFRELFL